MVQALTDAGLGQTTCVGIGGDPIVGTSFIDILALFNADPQTEAIVMIGEIGGDDEERAAAFIAREVRKPMAAFIAGRTAPAGAADGSRRRDHLGGCRDRGVEADRARVGRRPRCRLPVAHPPLLREAGVR